MPGLDKTGPTGQGALTGRKTGRCTPEVEKLTGSFLFRRRFAGRNENSRNATGDGRGPWRGLGRGFGRGWGRNRG